jgi:geranylgeranyl pyrophosphate synthase
VARVRAGDEEAARELGQFVRGSGACERVRILARAETDRALAELAGIPAGAAREALADVARELAARAS